MTYRGKLCATLLGILLLSFIIPKNIFAQHSVSVLGHDFEGKGDHYFSSPQKPTVFDGGNVLLAMP
jgi:hypothetical protein